MDGRVLAPGEVAPQLDRTAAAGVMRREEAAAAASVEGEGGLITRYALPLPPHFFVPACTHLYIAVSLAPIG